MLSLIQFSFMYVSYTEQMSGSERIYLYEMYKHNPRRFSISRAVNDINKLRTIKLPREVIIQELVY